MTLSDLYPDVDVRLYSEVETKIMTGREVGEGGRVRWVEGEGEEGM